jgi:hypothetical protein
MARLLGVSVTGYFDWLHRKPSKRQREREQALKLVTAHMKPLGRVIVLSGYIST